MCRFIWKGKYLYAHCKKRVYCIDLHDVEDGCYFSGELICIDLVKHGWIVVRDVRISDKIHEDFDLL